MIASQRRHASARRLDQVLDDRRGNVVAVQRRLERALVAARARVEPVALTDGVVEGGVRVQRRAIGLVQRGERLFAIRLLAARREDGAILPVRDGDRFAGGERHRRKLRVGRGERPVGVVGRRRQPAGQRHEALAGLVEHVLLLPVEVLDREPVDLEVACLIHPLAHAVQRNLQQFGVEPGLGLLPAREQDLDLLSPGVDGVVALVLIVLKRRVVPDAIGELAQLL